MRIGHTENCGIHHDWCPDPSRCIAEAKLEKPRRAPVEPKSKCHWCQELLYPEDSYFQDIPPLGGVDLCLHCHKEWREQQTGDNDMPKYEINLALQARLDNTFTYHAPQEDQPERYTALREKAKELAILICETTPPSREQSLALTKLEEVSMQANAAIARHEG